MLTAATTGHLKFNFLNDVLHSKRSSEQHWKSLLVFAASTTIYGRYKFVQKLAELMRLKCPCLNTVALVFGMLSCFGMCVVATFQVTVHIFWLLFKQMHFPFFTFFCVHFRKQQCPMFIELERFSSLYLGLCTWSSSVLFRTIPLHLEHPSLCAECVWALL